MPFDASAVVADEANTLGDLSTVAADTVQKCLTNAVARALSSNVSSCRTRNELATPKSQPLQVTDGRYGFITP